MAEHETASALLGTHRCPSCDFSMTAAIRSTIEVSLLVFCPSCQTLMDNLDALGEIEAAHRSAEPETFEEFVKRPDVLGVIENG